MKPRLFILLALFWAMGALAQTGSRPVPPLMGEGSPWGKPTPAADTDEDGEQPSSQKREGDSFFIPVKPPSEGFDYFDDEEKPSPRSRGRDRKSGAEGKASFKLLERTEAARCENWGSGLLDNAYSDRTSCEFELEKRTDEGRAWIEELVDKVERTKLRKVMHHQLASRAEAAKYEVKFDDLSKTLDQAIEAGCKCLN